MAERLDLLIVVVVNRRRSLLVFSVELADVSHPVQRDAHRHHELCRGKVDARDHLRYGVLHLQPRVELEERERGVLFEEEVLHRASVGVADFLGEAHCGGLHLLPHRLGELVGAVGEGRTLLDDLLVATLHRAVATGESDGVPVLVRQQLHLEVARVRREAHEEDRRAWHFALDLAVRVDEAVGGLHHADALASAALGRLHHQRVADALGRRHRLLNRCDVGLGVHIVRDATVSVVADDAVAGPLNARNLGRLSDNCRANLVAEREHRLRVGADEHALLVVATGSREAFRELLEPGRQLRVLGGVAPACNGWMGRRGGKDRVRAGGGEQCEQRRVAAARRGGASSDAPAQTASTAWCSASSTMSSTFA